jgi:hypothetical protein
VAAWDKRARELLRADAFAEIRLTVSIDKLIVALAGLSDCKQRVTRHRKSVGRDRDSVVLRRCAASEPTSCREYRTS